MRDVGVSGDDESTEQSPVFIRGRVRRLIRGHVRRRRIRRRVIVRGLGTKRDIITENSGEYVIRKAFVGMDERNQDSNEISGPWNEILDKNGESSLEGCCETNGKIYNGELDRKHGPLFDHEFSA